MANDRRQIGSKIKTHLSDNKLYYLFLFFGLFVRLANLPQRLYFTWDQGRDAWMYQHILTGNLTLVGPTSGLHGFFLGPLWYYLGVPGSIIGGGDPYLISIWYILLGALSLPIFWLLAHYLLPKPKDKPWAVGLSFLLALIPASINGGTFIWNPLISLPLVAGAVYTLLRSRESRWWLVLSFWLWALTLQSEFAYAVFFIIPLWLMIPWIRGQRNWRDFVYTALAVATTLVPQILFELRHQFIMTKSLWLSMRNPELSISWLELWSRRPEQLFWITTEFFFPKGDYRYLGGWLMSVLILGAVTIIAWPKKIKYDFSSSQKNWQIISLLAILPYIFYMFWRGNYGNFFNYYLTPHFILITPLVIFALRWLSQPTRFTKIGQVISITSLILLTVSLIQYSAGEIRLTENNSGLRSMTSAVQTLYSWNQQDQNWAREKAFRIFTPNAQTEHYDYLIHHLAKNERLEIPPTVKSADTQAWYILVEPDRQLREARFLPWYKEATSGGVLIRQAKVGDLELEAWAKPEIATLSGLVLN